MKIRHQVRRQNLVPSSNVHLSSQELVRFESKGKRVRALLTAQSSSHDPFTEAKEEAKEKRQGRREERKGDRRP